MSGRHRQTSPVRRALSGTTIKGTVVRARHGMRRAVALLATMTTVVALSVTSAPLAAADSGLTQPTLQTKAFASTSGVQSFTAPGTSATEVQLIISMVGGQGGRGGYDGSTVPAPGGYVGVVSGTVTVPGGTTVQIAVGAGGATGANSVRDGAGATGGANPFGGYGGGKGGTTGTVGTSGAGGGGGAATVIKIGGKTLVAGGAGGGGGSGNGGVLTGRAAEASFSMNDASGNTNGTGGESVPTSGNQLDGGGAGGGGGGATGGAGARIEYGSGSTMEWFGYGGYPGANATGGYAGLTGSYQYYSGNGAAGSVIIKYVDGPPAAAQNVTARTGSGAGTVDLRWDEPVNSGLGAVTGYVVQYSADGGSTWNPASLVGDGATVTGSGGKTTVTGLDGGEYVFRVAATNGYGTGGWSVVSAAATASDGGDVLPDSPWPGGAGSGGVSGAEHAHVVPGDGTLTVTWDGDGSGGTTAPDAYTVHVYDGSGTEAGNSPRTCGGGECTVSGLDPGQEYTTVIETPGTPTNQSDPVGPYLADPNVQSAWDGATVVRGENSITVTWSEDSAPGDQYHVHVYDADGEELVSGSPVTCSGATCTVSDLDPNSTYQIAYDVPAETGDGGGEPEVDEGTPSGRFTVPAYDAAVRNSHAAPVDWNGTAGAGSVINRNPDGTITVGWPGGDAPDSAYLLHLYDDDGEIAGSPMTCGANGPCTSGYLDPSTEYAVAVEVPNRTAPSPAVSPSVTDRSWTAPQDPPRAVTGAPTKLGVTAQDKALAISFTAPAAQPAGNQILYYQYSLDGGATWAATGAFTSPATVGGLTNGTGYSVRLRALTLEGPGAESGAVTGTPRGYPSAPYSGGNPANIRVTGISGNNYTVSWSPFDANGSPISSYTLTAFNAASAGSSVRSCATNGSTYSCTLSGLTGTVHLSVQAINGVGASPRSHPRVELNTNAKAPNVPGVPTVNGGVLTWTVPAADGSHGAATSYELAYSTDGGETWATFLPSSGPTVGGGSATAGVTGLAGEADYLFRVRALNGALPGGWSTSDSVRVAAAVTPEFGTVTGAPGGFTIRVENYDASLTWAASASPGSASVDGSGLVTVTGLAASQSATVTVTATAFGTGSRQASVSGSALGGTAPILSAATPIDGGFTVQIVNWAVYKNGRYGPNTVFVPVPAPTGGITYAGPDKDGVITVTGIGDGDDLVFSLTVASDEHTATTGAPVTGMSLKAAVNPTFGLVTPTSDGFTVTITNFDRTGATVYALSVDNGKVAGPDGNGVVTVSGLTDDAETTLTVNAQEDGHAVGTATKAAGRLATGGAPGLWIESRGSSGFTAVVTVPVEYEYDDLTLSVMVSDGAIVTCASGVSKQNGPLSCAPGEITVSGVASGESATVTAYLWDPSHGVVSAAITGQALYEGVAPEFENYTRTDDGFTVDIANWDIFQDPSLTASGTIAYVAGDTTVDVSASAGELTLDGSNITVADLDPGQQATVTVTVAEIGGGHTTASAAKRGQANLANEHFSKYMQAEGAYSVKITDFSAENFSYTVELTGEVPGGAHVKCGVSGEEWASGDPVECVTGEIIVTGLGAGVEAGVTVHATLRSQGGEEDPSEDEGEDQDPGEGGGWISSFEGAALRKGTDLSLSDPKRTAGGFEFTIDDYDSSGDKTYAVALTNAIAGVQVSRVGPRVVVSGLDDGALAMVAVTVSQPGYTDAFLAMSVQAKDKGIEPVLALGERTATGFTAHISNQPNFSGYDPDSWKVIVMVTNGAKVECGLGNGGDQGPRVNGPIVCDLTEMITVSGVASGKTATLTAAVIDKDHLAVTSDGLTGQAQFAGVAPTFGEIVRTPTGFTTSISNWDVFQGDAASGDPAAVPRTSAYVADDTTVKVKVSAVNGSNPSVQCDNSGFVAAETDALCSAAGAIAVTGLTSDQQATVTVSVTEGNGNHVTSFAVRQGQALATGTTPGFDDERALVKSFTVKISNYDPAASYTITATQGDSGSGAAIPAKNITFNSSTHVITVTGLADGAQATVLVKVAAAGTLPAEATHIGSALKTPIAPILAVTGSSATGFTVSIVNRSAYADYGTGERPVTFTPDVTGAGDDHPTVIDNHDGTFTVTGVTTGETATVAVTATQADHPPATSDPVTGTALFEGVVPTLGTPTRTADGFRVPITNYQQYTAEGEPTVEGDENSTYGTAGQFAITVTGVSTGGAAKGDVKAEVIDGTLQVSKLAHGQTATLTVTGGDGLTRHQDATSAPVTGQALFAPVPATFGSATATLDSVTVPVTNFSASTSYTVVASPGKASRAGAVITVAGLKPGETATITVIATPPGHVAATAAVAATALKVPEQSGTSAPGQLADGFTARIVPFDSGALYSTAISGAPGATVSISGDVVTVRGMASGDTVTVTITVTKAGYAPATVTITYTLPADAGTEEDPSGGATPPEVGELAVGESAVIVDGVAVPSRTTFGARGVVVTWRGMTMTAAHLRDGKRVPPGAAGTPDGLFTVPFTGSVRVDVSGFAPRTRVQLWAFSTPTLLGTFTVKGNANGTVAIELPEAVFVGDHTLVATGLNTAGEHVSMSTAMRVTPLTAPGTGSGSQASGSGGRSPGVTKTEIIGREEIAYTGTHTVDELRIAAGLLLAGMVMIAIGYRRKREDPSRALVGDAAGLGPTPPSGGTRIVAFGFWRRTAAQAVVPAAVPTRVQAHPVQASVSAALATVPNLANATEVPVAAPVLAETVTEVPAGAPMLAETVAEVPAGAPMLAETVAEVPAEEPVAEQPAPYRFLAPRREPGADWMHLVLSLGTATR